MTIKDILLGIDHLILVGETLQPVSGLTMDSRQVQPGYVFVAINGTHVDGHLFIDKAINAGAICIIAETLPTNLLPNVVYVTVQDTSKILGLVAANYYGQPSQSLTVVGVTGTNGKTTTTTLLFKLFSELGYKCGLISTVKYCIGNDTYPSTHTTPDAISIQRLFSEMLEAGCSHVFMEVSSHAIDQGRIVGIDFDGAVFTNITHDHLDYHHTFDNYIKCKKAFFDGLKPEAFALSNIDDRRGEVMLQNTAAKRLTYALKNDALYKAKVLSNKLEGLELIIQQQDVHLQLKGIFNAYNALAVYGVAVELGKQPTDVLTVLSTLQSADGRFDTILSKHDQVLAIVDYAHTPDALLNVLSTIQQMRGDAEQVITVIGCGGDRDKTKRPEMGLIACEHSDKVIFTSDNPRSENPNDIINDMMAQLEATHKRKLLTIEQRAEAIKAAVHLAKPKDIILIAGKGHETYQEINGVRSHFDDKEIVLESFKTLNR